ncbi:hypothetical protein DBB36_15480 [Flavobacterium sp. WLB]|uniref:hypothetical protein n=1 Tax=unclassified Flavobacterium TaxID=196869 RepID=UPI0006ABA5B0|nr:MULTISPECIES: hypothetical protein [unclassified Flavobacterium]KOP36131.1 hypothetical protein AKO67_21530 [Flavobacterium sp. VMW]OWU88586.1 hypothetical protein APR43_21925 [Flavobacterium sp. NLM]PUU69102.1 hypothetical protein DBB36_15480 [Flavobacterium sp. WLB]
MDNQDKIFNRFKEAADNAEPKDFPGMEKVWSRLEDKLDRKEDKKSIALWKKIAVAASLLLVISLGYQFLKTDKTAIIQTSDKVVVNESEKETIDNSALDKNKAVVVADSQLVSKEEAAKILEKQKQQEPVAIHEVPSAANVAAAPNYDAMPVLSAPAPAVTESAYSEEETVVSKAKDKIDVSSGYSRKMEKETFKASAAEMQSQRAKKSAPLVILNGNAMAHSDEVKKDKMIQAEITNLEPENVESLVVLDEPLYIIDGIYYSENDLFGNNPTSPYAPLDKQDIKTITILQDLEATSKYGEKGKKGVVIITTKTGKPALKK